MIQLFQIVRRWTFLAAFLVVTVSASAQVLTSEIDGTVRDTSGASVPGATVTVWNVDQNVTERVLQTNQEGEFSAPELPTGNYRVKVERQGFQSSIQVVTIHVNQVSSLHVALRPGATTETVTVTANPNVPELQVVAAQTLIIGDEAKELPLSSRNYQQLLLLQPGISGDIPGTVDRGVISSSGTLNTAQFQANGQQSTQNSYYLDGSDIVNHGGNGQSTVFPSIDALQEISFLRNSYGAQYAGIGGAIVLMQTRAGTTHFHGSAYGFFRTTPLNANNYFNNLAGIARPTTRYNDFGGTFGGPVWFPGHSRGDAHTFFFVSEEMLRSGLSTQATLTGVPTADQRNGIFAHPVCVAYTTSAQTTCSVSTTKISTFNAMSQAYLKDIIDKTPTPNSPTDPQGYIFNPASSTSENQTIVRIDHRFGDKMNVFFRYMNDPFHLLLPHGILLGQGPLGVGTSRASSAGSNYLGHVSWTLNPKTVIEGGYAYERFYLRSTPIGTITPENSPDIRPVLPYVSTLDRVPGLTAGLAYTSYGPLLGPPTIDNQVFVNVTRTQGRHTLYFGGQFLTYLGRSNNGNNNAGSFTVTKSASPAGSAASVFEQTFAQFLVGNITTFTQTSSDILSGQAFDTFEAYLQDNFRVTPRLTINAGLRYTHNQAPRSSSFMGSNVPLSTFIPAKFNPANAPALTLGGLICTAAPCSSGAPNPNYVPTNGMIIGNSTSPYGAAVAETSFLNFAPRLGAVLDVFGDGTTSLRSGYGIFYVSNTPGIFTNEQALNPPYVSTATVTYPDFSNPAAGVTPATPTPPAISATDVNQKTGYIQLFNLDVQRSIGRNSLIDVGYYGNHALHLVGLEELNQPQPGAYVTAGLIASNGVNGVNSVLLNRIRPYIGYSSINYETPRFMSNYNSLQVAFTYKFGARSVFNANYTYGKALTNSPAQSGSAPQNVYDLAAEYGPTLYNRTHVANARLTYDLPSLAGHSFATRGILGGWELSMIGYIASGRFLTETTTAVDPAGIGLLSTTGIAGVANRPDQIGNPNRRAPHTQKQWFNVSTSFANVPKGQPRVGNASVGSILGPGYMAADLSVFKNFNMPKHSVFQLRVEAFNAPNHTNFNAVSTILGTTNQGQVTSAGQARVLQLAGKLTF